MTKTKENFLTSLLTIAAIYLLAFMIQGCASVRVLEVDDCLQHVLFPESSAGVVRVLDKGFDFYMVMNLKAVKYRFDNYYVDTNYRKVSCEKVGF